MDEPKHFWVIVDIYTNVFEALIDTLHFDENFFWNDGGGPVTVKEENLPSLQQSCNNVTTTTQQCHINVTTMPQQGYNSPTTMRQQCATTLGYHRRPERASTGDH